MSENSQLQSLETTPVILFKTPNPSPSTDPYHYAFSKSASSSPNTAGEYKLYFIPVLQESYDLPEIVKIIEQGPEPWEGVIVTSRRGMEGWVKGVQIYLGGIGKGKEREGAWDVLPLFSVGHASTEHLAAADIPPSFKPRPVPEMESDPPKSAIPLSELILRTSSRRNTGAGGVNYRPYLFLCGDKSLDEMPTTLRSEGRTVKEVMVYATSARDDFQGGFGRLEIPIKSKGWLAFFSPSSAAIVMPQIKQDQGRWDGWRVFAIGETTKRYLEEEAKIEVHAVADKPDAEGTFEAIMKAGR
nr:uroporphyrinogen-III synthase [Cryptococcus tetragattii IND107]